MWPFRLLLRAYPPPFRRLYADELEADFAELLARARCRGTAALVRLWLRVAVDTVRTGLSERWSGRAYRRPGGLLETSSTTVRIPHRSVAMLASEIVQDARIGVRSLRRAPGYVLAVLITLSLGIGANTALFSVAYGTLLRPLPFQSGDRLVRLVQDAPPRGGDPDARVQMGFSVADLTAYAQRLPGLEELSEFHSMTFTLIDEGGPHRVRAGVVSANYFEFLGLEALHGRLLRPSEDHLGAEPVVVLAHDYWRERFGGTPEVVGRRVRMNDRVHEIVGVLPPGPQFPVEGDLFLPLSACPTRSDPAFMADPEARMMYAYGRLEAEVDVETTAHRADSLLTVLASEDPTAYPRDLSVRAVSLRADMVAGLRPITAALLALAGLVWLIACANASGLALARASRRIRELEVRGALGAGRGRLVRTLLAESVVLAVIGGLLGLGVAAAGHDLLVGFAERFTTRAQEIRLDRVVLSFAAGTSLLAGLIFGSVPGLWVGRRERITFEESEGRTLGPRGRTIQRALVVGQVAVAFAVVTAAGLSLRTLWALDRAELGFETEAVAGFEVPLDQHRWHSIDSARALFARITEGVAAVPAVSSAIRVAGRPLAGERHRDLYRIASREGEALDVPAMARVVDPGFFELLGLDVVEGRPFDAGDGPEAAAVAVINRAFQSRYLRPDEGVGTRLIRCHDPSLCLPPVIVVGVVDDVRLDGVEGGVEPEVYEVARQSTDYGGEHIVVGFSGHPDHLEESIIAAVRAVEPALAVSDFTSLEALREEGNRPRRFLAALLASLGAVAVGLAVTGLFGVAALSAASRRRELGLRRALGASPRGLVALVLAEGLWIAAAGIGVGVVLTWGFGTVFSRFFDLVLWGVAPTDPVTWSLSAVLFLIVAALAAGIPARSVARVDVMQVLQNS